MNNSTTTAMVQQVLDKLRTLRNEMFELVTLPVEGVKYDTEGLQALTDSLLVARAYGERAAAIQAQATLLKARAHVIGRQVSEAHTNSYDAIVAASPSLHASSMSWEERGSLYRTKTIDTLMPHRAIQTSLLEVDAEHSAIESLARQAFRARGDLAAVSDAMRMGNRLGEV